MKPKEIRKEVFFEVYDVNTNFHGWPHSLGPAEYYQ
jgi:hypothetical protein